MKSRFLLCLGAASVLATACGVTQQSVPNNPPVVDHDATVFSQTYGKFDLTVASAFLWPENLTEDQAADLVMRVNTASMSADPLFAKLADLYLEGQILNAEWASIDCVKKYAVLGPGDDPDIGVDHVSQWKTPDPSDQKSISEVTKCQANQSRRDQIGPETAAVNRDLAGKLDVINKAIDPDQSHIVNAKSLDFSTSSLSISKSSEGATKVDVKLGKFLIPSYAPSTSAVGGAAPVITNASYDESLRLLSFDVPEVDSATLTNGAPQMTGNIFRFRLERGPNVGKLASFRGDMNLYSPAGKIVRYGTARIDGFPPR